MCLILTLAILFSPKIVESYLSILSIFLELQIPSSLSWRDHVVEITKSASKKLGVLFQFRYFNFTQLCNLDYNALFVTALIIVLLCGMLIYLYSDRVEPKAGHMIGDPILTLSLDHRSLCRKIACLFLLY